MTRPARLSHAEVDAALGAAGSPWRREGDELVLQFRFEGFPAAISFVEEVARHAEALNHHPDIDVRYDTVRLAVTTHDQGGLTALDLELAALVAASIR